MENIRQRKEMAMGKTPDAGNFGVKSLAETNSNGKSQGSSDATILSEKQRCAPVKGGDSRMMNQASPDHGSH